MNPDERQPRGGDAGCDRLGVAQRKQHQLVAACLRHSSVTIESLPPPTGTQVRRGKAMANGGGGVPSSHSNRQCPTSANTILPREFGQTLFVKILQEFCGLSIESERLAAQGLRDEGLVIAYP